MRVTLTILVDVPDGNVMGTKECIAHQLEQYGLVRVVDIRTTESWEQTKIGGKANAGRRV